MPMLLLLLLFAGDPAPPSLPPHLADIPAATQTQGTGPTTVAVGKTFLGKPYAAGTLDQNESESLTYHFDRFDCVTLVETSLALAQNVLADEHQIAAFEKRLTQLRYRDGKLDGYPSRLHYFTDWARDNAAKGFLRDVTQEIGGEPWPKTINFMSQHRNAYPHLQDDADYHAIQKVEANLEGRHLYYIPKDRIQAVEGKIKDGDILALTTGIKGLDIVHTGIAVHTADGRLHMLHASSASKQVEITTKPLADYSAGVKSQTGLIVLRPLNPGGEHQK